MKNILLITSFVVLMWCSSNGVKETCKTTTVASVGGCGAYVCAVKYADGTYGSQEVNKSVVGNTVKYCQ